MIATASLSNASFLKSLGATHVLDRRLSRDSDALHAEIWEITPEPFKTIYDAAGTTETQNLGYDFLAAVQRDVPEKTNSFRVWRCIFA